MEGETRTDRFVKAQVGGLAPGIAHEINNPLQFLSGNIHFLREHFAALTKLLSELAKFFPQAEALQRDQKQQTERIASLHGLFKSLDPDFILTEIPLSLEECLQGIERICEITDALRRVTADCGGSHDECRINELLAACLTVMRNKMKYTAEARSEFCPQNPSIYCDSSKIAFVFMTLLERAIMELTALKNMSSMGWTGQIKLTTSSTSGGVEVSFSYNSQGIDQRESQVDFLENMTLVDEILETHGGYMKSFETPQETRITVWLPEKRLMA